MDSPRKTSRKFGQRYFQTGNYAFYRERRERYHRTARELSDCLLRSGVVEPYGTILDYGCGYGYLAEGFRKLGYEVWCYDICEIALREIAKAGLRTASDDQAFDLLVALDVFEHMTDSQVRQALRRFHSRHLLVRIPCALDGQDTFHLAISRNDKTHINCKDKHGWQKLFRRAGYPFFSALDLFTAYDTDGVLVGTFSQQPLKLR